MKAWTPISVFTFARLFFTAALCAALPVTLATNTAAAKVKELESNLQRRLYAKDGDSLGVRGGREQFRLLCIDAPEYKQRGGREAKRALARLLKQGVRVFIRDKDRYGRRLVLLESRDDGRSINLQMLRLGHAWVFRRFADTCGLPRALLCQAEKQARNGRRGLWQARNPQAPWLWRENKSPRLAPRPC